MAVADSAETRRLSRALSRRPTAWKSRRATTSRGSSSKILPPVSGSTKPAAGRGTAIFDYDNDGYLDIAIATAHGGISLYHNNGDGTFTDVSVGSGLDGCVKAFAITVGDYNNDGLYRPVRHPLRLLCRARGNCSATTATAHFTDVTAEAGLSVWGPAFAASWVDYDSDGFLDLYHSQ